MVFGRALYIFFWTARCHVADELCIHDISPLLYMWALVFETKPPPRTKPHRHASALSPEHGWRERERERTRKSQPPGGLYSCVLWT